MAGILSRRRGLRVQPVNDGVTSTRGGAVAGDTGVTTHDVEATQ